MENLGKIIGKYQLVGKIGEGGMADVYEGKHIALGTRVAVKILKRELMTDTNIRRRFENEATLVAKLDHPNITRVIDCEFNGDLLAIMLEFLEGQDLNNYIRHKGVLPLLDSINIFIKVLEAFQYAHTKAVLHRDIKPANIFVLNNNDIKILDFGIAKIFGDGKGTTKNGLRIGTPVYMSPEQIKGDVAIDHRSDIYSLGVTLYFLICGKPPYDSNYLSDISLIHKIVYEKFPQIENLPEINKIIEKAVEKDPNLRYQECNEFKQELSLLAGKLACDNNIPSKNEKDTVIENITKKEKLVDGTYNEYITTADNFFAADNFTAAKKFYKKAYEIKTTDAIFERIKICDEKLLQKKPIKTNSIKRTAATIIAFVLTVVMLFFVFVPTDNSQWKKASKKNTIEAYNEYLSDYPNGKHQQQAEHEIDWLEADSIKTKAAYNEYITKYQTDSAEYIKRKLANQRIAEIEYDSLRLCSTLAELRAYKKSDKYGSLSENYKNTVTNDIDSLVTDSTNFVQNLALQQADKEAFENAEKICTIEAFENYIATHTNGAYIDAARERISLAKSFGYETVYVSGGTFNMGSNDGSSDEKPIHTVTVSSFYIGKYEVTQQQWKAIMVPYKACGYGVGNDYPVNCVSWNDVQLFIKHIKSLTGKTYRLPTEAEWEFAARGGNSSNNYKYAGSDNINSVAWYDDNSGDKMHKVGTKSPNELGIYDMSGNVWEWCADWYDEKYYSSSPKTNPQGAVSGEFRVLRGGSWVDDIYFCRVALRLWYFPYLRNYDLGFRLVLL